MKGRWNAEGGRRRGVMHPAAPVSSVHPSSFILHPSSVRPRGGFTLLEIVMALTLLALLSGMVFGIVRIAMRTAMDTRAMQMENDEVSRFIMLCRHTFQNLPSTAILTLKITETGTPVQQELTISGVPETFAFGVNPMSYKDTILGLRPDLVATEASETGERLYSIGLSREDLIPTDPNQSSGIASTTGEGLATPDDQGRYWMPLLANVTSLNWRFLKEEDVWEEEWDSTNLPLLVEMNLLLKERTTPIRVVYAVPTTKLTAANPALAPKTTTTSSSSSASSQQSTTGTGGGGNDRGRGGDSRGGDKGRGGDMRGGSRGQEGGRGGPPGGGRPGGGGPQTGGSSPQPGGSGGVSSGTPAGGGR